MFIWVSLTHRQADTSLYSEILKGLYILKSSPAQSNESLYRAVAPRRIKISQAAATLGVVLYWPTCPFFISDCPPATNIFPVN